MSYLGISFKDNKEQQELIRLIYENNKPIIFCTGKAGTGKTFTALVAALQLKLDKKYQTIIYTRNPVQMGEDMGALPGGISDKFDPFMMPLSDNINNICFLNRGLNPKDLLSKIERMPVAFLRGGSKENTILIVDEAQNLNLTALQTILTRIGTYSKVIILGSPDQIDDYRQTKQPICDFERVRDALKDLPYVGNIELVKSMRSPWCAEIDSILSELKKS